MIRALSTLGLVALAACIPEPPAEPNWVDDVEPILVANCARCHGAPPLGGAPAGFRLDRYDDADDPAMIGAAAMADRIAVRVAAADRMPPPAQDGRLGGPPLTERQIDILVTWAELGAPFDASDDP